MQVGNMDRKGIVSLDFSEDIYTPTDQRRRLAEFGVGDLFDISVGS